MFDHKLYEGFKTAGKLKLERSSEDCVCIYRDLYDQNTGEKTTPEKSTLLLSELKANIDDQESRLTASKVLYEELQSLEIKKEEYAGESTTTETKSEANDGAISIGSEETGDQSTGDASVS